jgi:hypothetical protein
MNTIAASKEEEPQMTLLSEGFRDTVAAHPDRF